MGVLGCVPEQTVQWEQCQAPQGEVTTLAHAGGHTSLALCPCREKGGSSEDGRDVPAVHLLSLQPHVGKGQVPFQARHWFLRDCAWVIDSGTTRARVTLCSSLVLSVAPAVGVLPY